MPQAFVIEIFDRTAGIAVRETEGFRFYASDALFEPLGAPTFAKLRNLQLCAEGILGASRDRARPHRAGLAAGAETFVHALSAG